MSKLVRMQLFGIRSFGPDEKDKQDIKFQTPLTLIQGQNGCGKTTIIEALKYAVTGELPGGSNRGQGFVYDPKLAKAYETRGQVKLRILDASGKKVTVTKSVCLTQKGVKYEFKRLDSTLSVDNTHTSGKCIDVDNEMCLRLGVSKPVINSVIFCHQEESNWPLEEGQKLKERFDDIFDATKYNKCLELLNKYTKSKREAQKVLKVEVDACFEIKQYVERKHLELREKEDRLEEFVSKISELEVQFEPIKIRLGEIDTLEMNYANLHSSIIFKQKELDNLKDQQKEILSNIKEFTGTDEELKKKLTSFEADFTSILNDIKVLEKKKQEIEQNERKLRNNINEKKTQVGGLKAEEKLNKQKEMKRNELLSRNLKEFNLQNVSVDSDTTDDKIKSIILNLNTKLDQKKNDVYMLEKQFETDEKQLQNDIDTVRESNAQLKQSIQSKQKQLSDLKDEFRTVKNKLQEINTADEQLQLIEDKLNRAERETKVLEATMNVTEMRAVIESEKKKRTALEEQLSVVDSEIQTLQHYATLRAEIDMKKESSINKQNELQKLKNKHDKTFTLIFPDGLPNTDFKSKIEQFQKTQTHLVKDLNKKISEKQQEVTKLETNLNIQRDKLQELEYELESNRKEVTAYCEPDELETLVNVIQTKIENLQNERSVYNSSKYLFKKFIADFGASEPSCPICRRRVEEKQCANQIIDDLNKKIEDFPNQIRKLDQDLIEKKSKYEILLALKPKCAKLLKLEQNDVPKLREIVSDLGTNLKSATEILRKYQTAILAPQENEQLANKVVGDASLLDQYQKDLASLKREILSLSSQLPSDDLRGMQEVLSEQEALKINIRSTQNTIDNQQNRLTQHMERLQKQKDICNELISKQLRIKQTLQDKGHMITKCSELEQKIMESDSELDDLQTQLEPMKRKLITALETIEKQKLANKKEMDQSWSNYHNLKKILDDITSLQAGIEEYHRKDIPEQIETVNISINKFELELSKLSERKVQIEENVDDLKVQLTNQKVHLRELQDNIKLREKHQQQIVLEVEIKKLNEKLGNSNMRTIRKEKDMLNEKNSKLREEKHKAEGKRDELSKSIDEIRKELRVPKYTKAALNYKRKFLELELNKRGVEDLKEFMRAMEWALIQFHKQRMMQINHIIKELWRSIYKGNDCDYIEIKTDDTTTGTDKRKTYNYRVVQVKNEVEMNMRGRCSAGQKVLASLLIRIALADTFSTNCGILALDEPTTNLDRENISSLSEALIELIAQKHVQKNFQLLIITHDQEFVDKLTRVESLEYYNVVKRNEYGKSVITYHRR